MTVSIQHLFETPQHVHTVASWIYGAFWADRDGYSIADLESLLRDAADPDTVPLSLLAFVDGRPAGTVSLIENDDSERPHLRPWLAALYTVPEFRSCWVGSALVGSLCGEAARLGISELYLGTDIPGFYARFGAELADRNGDHHVMRLRVG